MGRVLKYPVAEERAEARKKQRKAYSQTKAAKLLRRKQNKRAYQRRTLGKSKLSPTWPTIPRAIHQQATLPLPQKSHFFLLEYHLREEVTENDSLAKWDYYPPYHIPNGSIGAGGLEAIVDQAHGRRLREQYQHEAEHLQRYNKGTDDEMLEEIDRDIKTYLTSWYELKEIQKKLPTSHVDHTMGGHLMQWKA